MDLVMGTENLNLYTWIQSFLRARGLDKPNRRPLYTYRVSDQEYSALSDLLRQSTGHSGLFGQNTLPMAWLLYAAEWWKRSYDGGAWAWNPVFESLGMAQPQYAQIQQLVERGRAAWQLNGGNEGGKRYIGVVATQGGLPLRLIETAHGPLSRLLRTVLRQAILCGLALQAIRAEVEQHQHHLPHSYRQAPLYDLLAEVVQVVKGLYQSHALKNTEDPVEFLNARDPQWMENFPLRIDCDSARQLIGGLIQEASQAEVGFRRNPIQMRRVLRFGGDGYCLISTIDVLSTTTPQAIAELFSIVDEQSLPPSFQISLKIGDKEYPLADAVHRTLSVRLQSRGLPPELLSNTQVAHLRLIRLGEVLFHTQLPGSDPLEPDMPWVFEDAEPDGRLLAIGSVRLTKDTALLCVPEGAVVLNEGSDRVELPSPLPGRALYRLSRGTTRIPLPDGDYRVDCAQEYGNQGTLNWSGRLLDIASQPTQVYIGLPTLYKLNPDGSGAPIAQGEFHWRVGSKPSLVSFRSPPHGMGTLVWKYANAPQTRLNAVLLPVDASIEDGGDRNSHGGTIWLKRWPALGIGAEAKDYEIVSEQVGADWKVRVSATGDHLPTDVTLLIAWPGAQVQRLTLPFPGTGAVFFDTAGKRMQTRERIDVESLLGTRLRLLPGRHRRHWEVSLTLRNGDSGPALLSRTYKYGLSAEIRLFEFMSPIREMLACTEKLDATVTIDALELNSPVASIRVGRYTAWLERDTNVGVLGFPLSARQPAAGVDSLDVRAIPISRPDAGDTSLKHARSDGEYVGRWWFNPELREPGPWLIFPDTASPSVFRPLIWEVSAPHGKPTTKLQGLGRALSVQTSAERIAALQAVVAGLVAHPEDENWLLLEDLVNTLGHLPLSGLDIWRVFASNPQAMIMALLHLEGFAEQIAPRTSEELPFEWLLTSPADWVACVRTLHSFWQQDSGPRGVRHLRRVWQERRETLAIGQPGVTLGLDLAGNLQLEITDRPAELLQQNPTALLKKMLARALSEDGPFGVLKRRPDDVDGSWPTEMKTQIKAFLSTPPARALFASVTLDRTDHKWPMIGMPVWLGYETASGNHQQWLSQMDRLHALRLYREFDRQWFDEGYRLGQVLAFCTGTVAL
ncbi:STY4851/ECs_5259 family protein [Pseudomonas sp. LM20]|uniref:STY4851/ECs_5259 family protein n=1 Tax=Pseudomonas sp. LM20 TaxID=2899116 RepID=UPI001F19F7BE|nr:STY4851/ECs_5259 family protein [Pseudomonas sp. LM20]MCE5985450.1 STY4851/ECs_5259 family protein [Pseudomonas sp. LM20]